MIASPRLGELADDIEDPGARADIDADGRRIQDEELRLGGQPFGDGDALLVAAGKRRDRILLLADLDTESARSSRATSSPFSVRDQSDAATGSVQRRDGHDCRRSIAAGSVRATAGPRKDRRRPPRSRRGWSAKRSGLPSSAIVPDFGLDACRKATGPAPCGLRRAGR